LFDRTTHRVALTPAGEAFVPAARATLRAAELARETVDAVRGQLRGRVTVGTMQGVWAGLHHALAALRAEHPGVVVQLRQAAVADIRRALREGTVQLAVVALDRQQQRGLVTRLLSREDMVLLTAPRRVLAGTTPKGAVRTPAVHPTVRPLGGQEGQGRYRPDDGGAGKAAAQTLLPYSISTLQLKSASATTGTDGPSTAGHADRRCAGRLRLRHGRHPCARHGRRRTHQPAGPERHRRRPDFHRC
jgi:DNA-binding transcriptional LysR family regulator